MVVPIYNPSSGSEGRERQILELSVSLTKSVSSQFSETLKNSDGEVLRTPGQSLASVSTNSHEYTHIIWHSALFSQMLHLIKAAKVIYSLVPSYYFLSFMLWSGPFFSNIVSSSLFTSKSSSIQLSLASLI